MAPPEEYAWYLLMSTENPRYRLVPDAGAWYEMRIMIGHGQRLGTRKKLGVSFYLVLRFGLMPPQMYPMHSRCEVAALVVVCPSLNSLLAHREGGERVWRIGMPDISIRFF